MGLERQGPKQETYAPGCKSTSPDGRLTDGERSQQGQAILDLDNDESRRSGCRPAHVSLAARPGSFYNRRVGPFIASVRLDDLRGGGFYVSETLFFFFFPLFLRLFLLWFRGGKGIHRQHQPAWLSGIKSGPLFFCCCFAFEMDVPDLVT